MTDTQTESLVERIDTFMREHSISNRLRRVLVYARNLDAKLQAAIAEHRESRAILDELNEVIGPDDLMTMQSYGECVATYKAERARLESENAQLREQLAEARRERDEAKEAHRLAESEVLKEIKGKDQLRDQRARYRRALENINTQCVEQTGDYIAFAKHAKSVTRAALKQGGEAGQVDMSDDEKREHLKATLQQYAHDHRNDPEELARMFGPKFAREMTEAGQGACAAKLDILRKYADHERPGPTFAGGEARCYDCGLIYADDAWADVGIPLWAWEKINPTYHKGAGLLCFNCMNRRLVAAGVEAPGTIKSGPMYTPTPTPPAQPDSIVEELIEQHRARATKGKAKYGVSMDRTDLDRGQWLEHLQEELMDAALYVLKLRKLADATPTSNQRKEKP